MGAATWPVEERVGEALRSTLVPEGAPPNTLFVPKAVCFEVLQWGHSSKLVCHPRATRTLHHLRQRFWWPSMAPRHQGIHHCLPCVRPWESLSRGSLPPAVNPATSLVQYCGGLRHQSPVVRGAPGDSDDRRPFFQGGAHRASTQAPFCSRDGGPTGAPHVPSTSPARSSRPECGGRSARLSAHQ